MAAFILESLVLRGSTVLVDGQAVELRRGTSGTASASAPEIHISMRLPSLGWRNGHNPPAKRIDQAVDYDCVAQAAEGAGRSQSQVGVSQRRGAATTAARLLGGEELPNAITSANRTAMVMAIGGETPAKRVSITSFTCLLESGLSGSGQTGKGRRIGKYGRTPPTRIPPMSTWETGCR
jgi:hypothetical protein